MKKNNIFEHHQKWLRGWNYGIVLKDLEEAKVAGCDYCIRKIRNKIKELRK